MKIKPGFLIVLLAVLILCFVAVVQLGRAAFLPQNTVYKPHGNVEVRTAPSFNDPAILVLDPNREYPVVSYNWTPQTASNSWACIRYLSYKECGWVPVQIDYWIYGDVRYNVGVFYGQ